MVLLYGSVIANAGQMLMVGALVSIALAFWMALVGLRKGDARLIQSAYWSALVFALCIGLAYMALTYAFLSHDFSISYVSRYSERAMPVFYLVCATWGGQDGSLLFWTFIMCVLSVVSTTFMRKTHVDLFPAFLLVVVSVQLFFAITTFFAADPFGLLPQTPPDGRGLNPLLQTPVMALHPPTLYVGMIAFYIPYAIGMAALISGQLDKRWIRATRPWTLFAWAFLAAGNMLGSYWAYNELGWGGFWAWDPVENASLLPWLLSTAFLHSAIVQERRGMLKIWNMSMLILTFFLTIFGTFITRSGLIASVHAFAQSDIGDYFVVFLVLILVVSFGLLWWRHKELHSDNQLESPISRESSFLVNNMLFSLATFIVLLGTTYPLLIEWATGTKATVSAPFYNRVLAPVAIALLLLLGLCHVLNWRKTEVHRLRQLLLWPVLLGLCFGIGFGLYYYILELGDPDLTTAILASLMAGLCAFIFVTIPVEIYDSVKQYRARHGDVSWAKAVASYLFDARRRYGGFIVHLGVVLMFFGFAGYGFRIERAFSMRPGEWAEISGYLVKFKHIGAWEDRQKRIVEAKLDLYRSAITQRVQLEEGEMHSLPEGQGQLSIQRVSELPAPEIMTELIWQPPTGQQQIFVLHHTSAITRLNLQIKDLRWSDEHKIPSLRAEAFTIRDPANQLLGSLRENIPLELPAQKGRLVLRRIAQMPPPHQMASLVWQRSQRMDNKGQQVASETIRQSTRQAISLERLVVRIYKLQWQPADWLLDQPPPRLQATLHYVVPTAKLAQLIPARHKHHNHDMLTTEVSVYTGIKLDFYTILATWETESSRPPLVHFKFYVNPLVFWLWLGSFLLIIGVIIALLPQRSPRN